MGTRHLTIVVKDEKVRVAQYGQWDGYPDYTGKGILNILREELDGIVNGLDNCLWVDDGILENMRKHVEEVSKTSIEGDWMTSEQSEVYHDLYPEQHRSTGYKILKMVADSQTPLYLRNSFEFANEPIWCEWAYVIDLDSGKFETYSNRGEGGQGIFARLGEDTVGMVASYDLDELPSEEEYMQQFIQEDE
tara:strand:+ start:928 stop:1500 length:573 start_codon:yes stop_codon:yes gene_type:complete